MPLKSQAQWRMYGHLLDTGEVTKQQFDEATHATPGGYEGLPARVGPKPKAKPKTAAKKPAVSKSRRGSAGKVKPIGRARTDRARRL